MTETQILSMRKRMVAEFMGFPKVTPQSSWDYDRSLDNAQVTRGLMVNDVNDSGVAFQQRMPYKRYGLDCFDGVVFTPSDKSLQKFTPSRPYDTSWDWLMQVVEKIANTHPLSLHSLYEWNGESYDTKWKFEISEDNGANELIKKQEYSCINSVWESVIEFIKWYNQNKTS
jgi:hypothetical protein